MASASSHFPRRGVMANGGKITCPSCGGPVKLVEETAAYTRYECVAKPLPLTCGYFNRQKSG